MILIQLFLLEFARDKDTCIIFIRSYLNSFALAYVEDMAHLLEEQYGR